MRAPALALAALAFAVPVPAPAAEAAFRVVPAGSGPQRLDAGAELLSASAAGDLADLRLAAAEGHEVPWLLVPPPAPAPRWIAAERIRAIPRTKTESGAEVDLGAAREVTGLRLAFGGHLFVKRLRIEGSADGRRWTTLADGETIYALAQGALEPCAPCPDPAALAHDEVRFPPATVRWLRAVLDDRRTPRLPAPARAEALLAAGAPVAGPRVPLAVTRRDGEPGTSRFALALPGPHLPVRAIVVEVDAPRIARRARVLEARLAGAELTAVELGSAHLLRAELDGLAAQALRVPVSAPEELELELAVDDGDDAPLALRAAWAELAPLPWIFFESPDGAPLEARLGDPARRAPRYDLEALRPALPRLRPAAARITGPVPPAAPPPPAIPDLAGAGGPGAPLDRAAFRFARAIPASPPGLDAVRLDAAVLARSPSLADVRLALADGRQVPYLVERRDEPLAVPLPVAPAGPVAAVAGRGTTVHALALPEPAFADARLVLETPARVFARAVRVYAEEDDPRARGPRLLASARWASGDPARPAPPLTVPLPPFRAPRLLVAVDDGDNAALPLGGARLLLPGVRLRFVHPGPALTLLHGAAELAPPRYDLALLAPRLRAAPARELALGPPPAAASEDRAAAGGRIAFWIVLGAAVLGLVAVVARLVGRGEAA